MIQDSELSRLRAVVDSAPSGLMMVDASGTIVLVNREIERIFGYARAELLGAAVEQLVPARFIRAYHEFRGAFRAQPSVCALGHGLDLFGLRKDGTEVPLEIGLTPIATDDGIYVLGAVVDVSARRDAERERAELELRLSRAERLESLGRLADGIAHDFNNVLATILSLAELEQGAVEGRTSKELEWIVQATDRGRDLVRRILFFSRGQVDALEPVPLGDVLPDVIAVMKNVLPGGVDVRLRIESPAPIVRSNASAIHQIVSNLVTNAAHAMSGGGTIEVCVDHFVVQPSLARLHPGLREGLYGRIEVGDSGIGTDVATRERAFDPFFTTRGQHGATGLGLAIVYGLTHGCGGAVWLEDRPTGGTVVTALLPRTDGTYDPAEVTPMPVVGGEGTPFVDDASSQEPPTGAPSKTSDTM